MCTISFYPVFKNLKNFQPQQSSQQQHTTTTSDSNHRSDETDSSNPPDSIPSNVSVPEKISRFSVTPSSLLNGVAPDSAPATIHVGDLQPSVFQHEEQTPLADDVGSTPATEPPIHVETLNGLATALQKVGKIK